MLFKRLMMNQFNLQILMINGREIITQPFAEPADGVSGA
jgi:hypothetical protein